MTIPNKKILIQQITNKQIFLIEKEDLTKMKEEAVYYPILFRF